MNHIRKVPLPKYLRAHRKEILDVFYKASGAKYDAEEWGKHFAGDTAIRRDLNQITKKCPNRITHCDVLCFAGQAQSGGYPQIRRLFLACMIWGYGLDSNGLTNTEQSLSDPRLAEVLKGTVRRIGNSQIKEAYEEFALDGCGPAFFTKFFYFVGKERAVKPLPVILDRQVANFLRCLGQHEPWKLSLFAKTSPGGFVKRYTGGYVQYIHSMDDWAQELGCVADNIEYFMYKQSKEKEERKTAEGEDDPIMWRRTGAHCMECGAFLTPPWPTHKFTMAIVMGTLSQHMQSCPLDFDANPTTTIEQGTFCTKCGTFLAPPGASLGDINNGLSEHKCAPR